MFTARYFACGALAAVVVACGGREETIPATGQDQLSAAPRAPSGDIDGSGCVDELDVCLVQAAFGSSGKGLAADVDRDGDVDLRDLSIVLSQYNPAACPPRLSADLDGDGCVTVFDQASLTSQFGSSGTCTRADIDHDGSVGLSDLSILLAQLNTCL